MRLPFFFTYALGPDATIVTIMCDSGSKYLSTALYGAAAEAASGG